MEVLLFQLAIFGTFIALGLFVGGYVERRHLADLDRREQDSQSVLCTQIKSFPYSDATKPPMMLCSEVVISSDYLKTLMAFIRKIFGGELRSFPIADRPSTTRGTAASSRTGRRAGLRCDLQHPYRDRGDRRKGCWRQRQSDDVCHPRQRHGLLQI